MSGATDLLTGMRVLSFTHWLQGPAAAQYLADMGADVIKVEAIGGGLERRWFAGGKSLAGLGTLQIAANRNNRNIVIDLKSDTGLAIARRLLRDADAVIENFRPGVMERLGLGYEAVRAENLGIVYASATGYGSDGPLKDRPGQDLLVQARAGLISQSWRAGQVPVPIGNSGIDQHGGTLLALGILGALIRRTRTGQGCRVEGSLYTACLDFMQEGLTHYFSGGHTAGVTERQQNLSSWYMDAPYGAYLLADGAIAVSMNSLASLKAALAEPRLESFDKLDPWVDRDRCAALLAEVLAERSFAEVSQAFEARGLWYEKINRFEDLRADPQAEHAQAFGEIEIRGESATVVNHPVRYDGQLPPLRHFSADPGEDTRAVLSEHGFDPEEIDRFLAEGAIQETVRKDPQ